MFKLLSLDLNTSIITSLIKVSSLVMNFLGCFEEKGNKLRVFKSFNGFLSVSKDF